MNRTLSVPSAGLRLAVREHTAPGPGRPTVVLVHGFPDQQDMWDPVIEILAGRDLHLVTYDVRGAGASDVPERVEDYRTELLVDDLAAVLGAVLPDGGRAHLVGHDWGSIQLWDALAAEPRHPGLRGRIASFTSVSGPSLDHAAWLGDHARGRRLRLVRQLLHSWYVAFFHLPLVPELVWRLGHRPIGAALARREGLGPGHWGGALAHNGANGVNLYRANIVRRTREPRTLSTDVPVLVVRPTRDDYVTGVLCEDLDQACSDVQVVDVDAGHWLPRTHPEVLADLVAEHVRSHI